MNVTIRDVARHAGVSAKTVSRVLNNLPVGEETRARVKESIDGLNYTPDGAGRRLAALKNGSRIRTGNIGCVLFPSYEKYTEPASAEILEELGSALLSMNLHQYFCYTLSELENRSLFAKMVNPSAVDGCVLVGLTDKHQDDIERIKERVSCVVLVGLVKNNSVTCIHPDGVRGGYLGTRHLISLGHKRIGCVTGYITGHSNSELRLVGYKAALKEAGIPFDPSLIVEGKFDVDCAARATEQLLKLEDRPTAIYSVSDPMAVGVYEAIQGHGLQIPGDISVVSFDNIKLASHLFPSLTTAGTDKQEMVRTAVQVLIDQIEGKSRGNREIIFPVELFERNSCRRLG